MNVYGFRYVHDLIYSGLNRAIFFNAFTERNAYICMFKVFKNLTILK